MLVSSIPKKWLSETALRGLFDVFPGGIKNIWLTHDLTDLLDKIKKRDQIHLQLEAAESDLIRECKKKQLKQRKKDEKKQRKQMRTDRPTKAQLAERQKAEDREAMRQAMADEGLERGDNAASVTEVPAEQPSPEDEHHESSGPLGGLNVFGGLNKVGQVFKDGAHVVGRAGHGVKDGFTVVGQGFTAVGEGVDHELERSGGFHHIPAAAGPSSALPSTDLSGGRVPVNRNLDVEDYNPKVSFASEDTQARSEFDTSKGSDQQDLTSKPIGNTTRTQDNIDDMIIQEPTRWYQFWKPPSGGYKSPVPQGAGYEAMNTSDNKSFWATIKSEIPFLGDDGVPIEYPPFVNPGQNLGYTESPSPAWEKWVKAKNRPHHHLPLFEFTPGWLPGLPFIHKKVDTIYWCREELARLNVEIEDDQKNTDRFPLMTSAFIQFHNQSAAHMACQSTIHHVPKRMAPRVVEVNPDDVIWDNMAMVSTATI